MKPLRLSFALLLALASSAAPLAAQVVRGQLVAGGTGFAIGGGFVVLLDEQGREVARALTNDDGRFTLTAPAAGTYRLSSKRIGFTATESPPITLAEGQTVGYRLEVAEIPLRLPPVVVEGRPQCGTRGEAGTIVAQLWEDAREALAAVSWTAGQRSYDFTIDMYEREYANIGGRIDKERSWTRTGASDNPFHSAPAAQLAEQGYVVDDAEGRTYFAPDANVLLSDVFLDTHCFTARDGSDSTAGMVGLAYAPVAGRRLPEVRGVLWVDRQTAELRYLDYQYVNLPGELPEGALGGRVDFLRLENGAWIVLRWYIRMPRMAKVVFEQTSRRPQAKVLGFQETGGRVTSIRTGRGDVMYSIALAVLNGTVIDSARGLPLSSATVRLVGTRYATATNRTGHFQFAVPFEGTYGLAFEHPRTDSVSYAPDTVRVTLSRGEQASVTLALPPESRVIQRLCPAGLQEGERVLVGHVRRSGTQRPVPGAEVRASWQAVGGVRGHILVGDVQGRAVADSAGRYVLCGIPEKAVTLVAQTPDAVSPDIHLEFSAQGVWIQRNQYRSLSSLIWTQEIELSGRP